MQSNTVRVPGVRLEEFCLGVFSSLGFSAEYAQAVTSGIMEAHMRGVHNQGAGRLPIYVKRIELGLINAKPNLSVVTETEATAVLDGDHGMGHYAGSRGMGLAVEKAKKCGIGAVGVRNSAHFGVAAHYGQIAARGEMIGLVFTNSTSLMAAPGGAERLIGNNPVCIAVPARGRDNIVLDMACTNVAYSRIQQAKQEGEKVPPGWGTDKNGVETDDPAEILDMGMLVPAGGYKGYGLAVMFDILAGVLTGSAYGTNVTHLYQDLENKQRTGHFFIALNIDSFMDRGGFFDRLEDYVQLIKTSRKAPGFDEILVPGEPEARRTKDAVENGIPLPVGIVNQLNELAEKFDITRLE